MKTQRVLAAIAFAAMATSSWSKDSENGFAVRQVIAEAGLHPHSPLAGAQKVETDEGHAYWVRAAPIAKGGLLEVGMAKAEDGWKVWLRVNDADARQMHDFTSANVGSQIALMLDGRIIGAPLRIEMPISAAHWETGETGPLVAYSRCLEFDKARDIGTTNSNALASKCRLPESTQ